MHAKEKTLQTVLRVYAYTLDYGAKEITARLIQIIQLHTLYSTHNLDIQWASPKTRIPYDFSSYVGRTELRI